MDLTYTFGRMFGFIPESESAYENLVTQMAVAEGGCIWSEQEARTLVDAVLHEAAEKQREEAWPHERDERENQLIYKLADLIDPEVER